MQKLACRSMRVSLTIKDSGTMAFEEFNAQTAVMDGIKAHANAIKDLLLENPLLKERRYSKALATLEAAVCLLVQAHDEIGVVERLQD